MESILNILLDYIKPNDRVIDLGCGDGNLLSQLSQKKSIISYGVDLDEANIRQCIQKGLSAFQGDIDEGLNEFKDNAYDVVILSQTLQQIKNPLFVMKEMCRVGKLGVVTFPNFAHWSCRWSLLKGEIPQSKHLPYDWYDTPNIRVVSLKSFKRVCKENGFSIVYELPLYNRHLSRVCGSVLGSNLCASKGLFIIKRQSL